MKNPPYSKNRSRQLIPIAGVILLTAILSAPGNEVPLASTWTLFDPEGNSSLSAQSNSGFTANISGVTDFLAQPAVVQEFNAVDMTQVGSSLRARFDISLLAEQTNQLDTGFRFAFYDTASNFEFLLGIDMGAPAGTAMRMRIDNRISAEDETNPPGPFIPGDYSDFCSGGGTLNPGASPDNDGIQFPEDSNSIELTLTRISANELEFAATWTSTGLGVTKIAQTSAIIDETSQATIDANDVPPSGSFTQMNGFGFKIFNNDPFDADNDPATLDLGSYVISNLIIDHSFVLPLDATWGFFDPVGTSGISNQSSSGFEALISDVAEGEPRPAVLKEFSALDISQVGQSIEVAFDVVLKDEALFGNDSDFRFSLYDTASNFEFVLGMVDLGPPGGTAMRLRIDNRLSSEDEESPPGPFIPGDYSDLAGAGGSLASAGAPSGGSIQATDDSNHFVTKVTRISPTELELSTTWQYRDMTTVSSSTISTVVDESAQSTIDNLDVPLSGSFTQMNGFGFNLYDDDPFDTDGNPATVDSGSYEISNFSIRYCGVIETPGDIDIVSVVRNSNTGDITITWAAESGTSYNVMDSGDLVTFDPTPVTTVTASGPSANYTIPSATISANPTRFYRIEQN